MRLSLLVPLLAGCGLVPEPASAQDPIPVTEGAGLCRAILNAGECAAAIEARQIPLSHSRVWRNAEGLHLRLNTGRVMTVVHDTTGESAAYFFFLGVCSHLGYYVLWVQPYEGHFVRLMNARTGWSVTVDDLPIVSPDRRRFVTVSLDAEVRANPMLEVWRVEGDTLRREWDHLIPNWGPENVRWLSNRRFEFGQAESVDTAEIDSTGQWTTRAGP